MAALQAAQLDGVHAGPPMRQTSIAPSSATSSSGLRSFGTSHILTGLNLGLCVGRFTAPGRVVQLVENARFKNKPATIIVTATPAGADADVWVVGESCSASHTDLKDHVKVAHI